MKISLYIPCFNAARTIGACLDAVFKQTYPIKEVLVVDDGSSDETAKIASGYRVRLMRHADNQGLAAARNTAIKNINTEFIASLDADCEPKADWLENLMKRFDSAKIAGAGGRLLEKHSSNIFDLWRAVHMKQHWEPDKRHPPFLFGSNTVFRREALIRAGLYNEDYRNNYEDVDICERIKKAGFLLAYEPQAIVYHLKSDNLGTILDNYWNWNLAYYRKRKWYTDKKNFMLKIKDNLGLSNRYIEEDIACQRQELVYLDFLLALHHTLRDFRYFISRHNQKHSADCDNAALSRWLALLDLTFFYHFDSLKSSLSTLMPKSESFLQNFFALDLILYGIIQDKFKKNKFKKMFFKHLFLSVCKINDNHLLDKLMNLVELHPDWDGLLKKKQPNLDAAFLKNLILNFEEWLNDLVYRFPGVIPIVESSAQSADNISF